MEETENWEPAPAPVDNAATNKQLPLSWERLEEGAAGLLAAAYLLILQDLVTLQAEYAAGPGESSELPEDAIPVNLPPMPQIKQALRQARVELSDLFNALS